LDKCLPLKILGHHGLLPTANLSLYAPLFPVNLSLYSRRRSKLGALKKCCALAKRSEDGACWCA